MTMLAQSNQERIASRRLSGDALIVYGLFVVTVFLLVASAVTGWRNAHALAPLAELPAAVSTIGTERA
jgi:hypothetical protein